MSVHTFCPFCNCIVWFCSVEFLLYILDTCFLSHRCFANNFSQSLFSLSFESLNSIFQKAEILIKSNLSIMADLDHDSLDLPCLYISGWQFILKSQCINGCRKRCCFSVYSGFSCCKKRIDNIQLLYKLKLKLEENFMHLYIKFKTR